MKLNELQKQILACFGGRDVIIKNTEIANYADVSRNEINIQITRLHAKGLLTRVRRGEHKLNKEFNCDVL